jgi:hypothetical protein
MIAGRDANIFLEKNQRALADIGWSAGGCALP